MATASEPTAAGGVSARRQAACAQARNGLLKVWAVVSAVLVLPVLVLSLFPQLDLLVSQTISAGLGLVLLISGVLFAPMGRLVTALAPRVVAVVFGLVSVALAWSLSLRFPGRADELVWRADTAWLALTPLALVVLLLAGFVFEMGRRRRERLIESFSSIIAAGVMAWSLGGWVFAVDLFAASLPSVVLLLALSFLLAWGFCGGVSETGGRFDEPGGPDEPRGADEPGGLADGGGLAAAAGLAGAGDLDASGRPDPLDAAADPVRRNDWPAPLAAVETARLAVFSFGSLPVVLTGLIVPLLLIGTLFFF